MQPHAKRLLLPAPAAAALSSGVGHGKPFLAMWLGGEPPNPEIEAGMLGGAFG
jgi:hypothetical protein